METDKTKNYCYTHEEEEQAFNFLIREKYTKCTSRIPARDMHKGTDVWPRNSRLNA